MSIKWEKRYIKSIFGGCWAHEFMGIPAECFKPFKGLEVWIVQVKKYTYWIYTRAGKIGWVSATHNEPGHRFTLSWDSERYDEPVPHFKPDYKRAVYIDKVTLP